MTNMNAYSQIIGTAGIGLRHAHYDNFMKEKQSVSWLEVHAENFLNFHTPAFQVLERIRKDYPISLHAVNLSLGSSDGVDEDHVKRIKSLIDRIDPVLVSDHLSWGRIDGYYFNDLLPFPYTQETLNVFCSNISRVQDILGYPLLVENPSSYLQFETSDMEEFDFLRILVQKTGANILLDVNNIYVSCHNHKWDMDTYLKSFPVEKVKEIHLAGHTISDQVLIDTHSSPVCPGVWDLYQNAINLFGAIPTLIEWDAEVPTLDVLLSEANKAQGILTEGLSREVRSTQYARFG